MEMRKPVLRAPRDKPQCDLCPKRLAWEPENRAVYRRWRFWRMGADVGPLTRRDFWDFHRLDETARQVERELRRIDFNRAMAGG